MIEISKHFLFLSNYLRMWKNPQGEKKIPELFHLTPLFHCKYQTALFPILEHKARKMLTNPLFPNAIYEIICLILYITDSLLVLCIFTFSLYQFPLHIYLLVRSYKFHPCCLFFLILIYKAKSCRCNFPFEIG